MLTEKDTHRHLKLTLDLGFKYLECFNPYLFNGLVFRDIKQKVGIVSSRDHIKGVVVGYKDIVNSENKKRKLLIFLLFNVTILKFGMCLAFKSILVGVC